MNSPKWNKLVTGPNTGCSTKNPRSESSDDESNPSDTEPFLSTDERVKIFTKSFNHFCVDFIDLLVFQRAL